MSDKQLISIACELTWLACLERAGVDNWSGMEFAKELFHEQYPEGDDDDDTN